MTTEQLNRIFHLLRLLQEDDMRTSRELAEICGCSRRTIFRDLERLETLGVRIDATYDGYHLHSIEDVKRLVFKRGAASARRSRSQPESRSRRSRLRQPAGV